MTLFEAEPLNLATASVTPVSGLTAEIDVSILGVSTNSAGTETTYSIGDYIYNPPLTIGTFIRSAKALTENCKLVGSNLVVR